LLSVVAALIIGGAIVAMAGGAPRLPASAVIGVTLVIWFVVTLADAVGTVGAGHVGLVKTWGAYTGVKEPGAVVIWPWQSMEEVKTRNASHEIPMDGQQGHGSAASSDSQTVFVDATVNYSLEKSCVVDLYTNYGSDYYSTVIEPRVKQIFKAETVQYRATDILPKREQIREETQEILDKQLERFCLRGIDFLLTNVSFSDEFEKSIEEKVIVSQRVQTKQNEIALAEKEKQRKIIEAEGDAAAAKIRQRELTPLLVEWERIQKWQPDVIYLPSNAIVQAPTGARP